MEVDEKGWRAPERRLELGESPVRPQGLGDGCLNRAEGQAAAHG